VAEVTITEIEVGDQITITDPNATLASFNDASGGSDFLDESNLASEGVDRRNIADETVTGYPSGTNIFTSAGAVTVASSVPAKVTVAGSDVQIGPIVFDADNEDLIVHCSFEYQLEDSPSAHATKYIGFFRIYYSTDNITYTALTSTYRKTCAHNTEWAIRGSHDIVHRFTVAVGSTSTLYFRLYAWAYDDDGATTPAVDMIIHYVSFFPRIIRT
jgi:hypothetical protein